MSYPKVYLAGKITGHRWRQRILSDIDTLRWSDSPISKGYFYYTGPFFTACDHGCYHGPNTHGSINSGSKVCPGFSEDILPIRQKHIANRCYAAIDGADFVFAYISERQCEGTLGELGYALGKGIPYAIAFAPDVSDALNNPFWLICSNAIQVIFELREQDLPGAFERCLEALA